MSEMLTAAVTLADLGPAVSVFGSARLPSDSPYCKMSYELSHKLAKAGLAVIAGGGPGIMEAANRGAYDAGGTSIGLNIKLPAEQTDNGYQTTALQFEYFYGRKATFFMHSCAYVALPGGFGTVDELFEALTLIQTGKLPKGPVYLVGSEFWCGMVDWIREQMLPLGMITPDHMDLFTIEDNLDTIVAQIVSYAKTHTETSHRKSSLPRS
ncbi:TIGR00730 family Rossman fold protein [Orrella sp. 11846]|uniref:LOG family protein n=1 Tax=Orrella sp. 11846 TaxID=3409913 RepID=UPI003B5A8D93